MRLAQPLALLSAIPIALLALWLLRVRGTGGRPLVFVLRCVSLALIVLALAQPQVGGGSSGHVVVAIERSLSIEEPGPESAIERAWLKAARGEGCGVGCQVVQFAGVPEATAASALLPIQAGGSLDGGQTDLQSALGLAVARAPEGGRVVLLSDGRQTVGEASATVGEARARHVAIDVVPLIEARPDVAVTRVQAPQALHAGDPFSLQITVTSTVASEATISLKVNGRAAAGPRKLDLEAGENPLAVPETAPPTPGSYAYEVSVQMRSDSVKQNNSLATTVLVESQPSALVAGAEASTLAGTLGADGIKTTLVEPQALPTSANGYAGQDAVVLSDVSASELGDPRAEALADAVRTGTVGLVALGGPHSFSLGRYYASPLQKLLPVRSLVPGNIKGAVALELVLDHSGSMIDLVGEYPKIEMAQTASRVAAQTLAQHQDELGLVAFNVKATTVVRRGQVTKGRNLRHTETLIDSLQAEGGTKIDKGLEAGAKELEHSKAPDRHIILMTDGYSEEPESYKALLPELHKDHIRISTIALGDEADEKLLEAIAHETGGNYYRVSEAGALPSIFKKETRLSARPVLLHGKSIKVSAGEPSPVLESVARKPLPTVHGNVATTLKQGAQADLLSQDSSAEHKTDPALAQWQYGVGRVLTWTPGLAPEWAGAWSGEAQVWQDAVRWVERGVGLPALTPVVAASGQRELEVDTVRNAGVTLDDAELTGSLTRPNGKSIPLSFTQTAPSHYEDQLPEGQLREGLPEGVYGYTISDGPESTHGLLALPYPAEYMPERPNATVLGPLAAATGGQVLGADDERAIATNPTSLWPWLALSALLCFLADIALRMLGGPRSSGGRLRAQRARRDAPTQTEDRELARS